MNSEWQEPVPVPIEEMQSQPSWRPPIGDDHRLTPHHVGIGTNTSSTNNDLYHHQDYHQMLLLKLLPTKNDNGRPQQDQQKIMNGGMMIQRNKRNKDDYDNYPQQIVLYPTHHVRNNKSDHLSDEQDCNKKHRDDILRSNPSHNNSDIKLSGSSFFNQNHISRWFFHNPINIAPGIMEEGYARFHQHQHATTYHHGSSGIGTSIVNFSPVPPHPWNSEPYQSNSRIWKDQVILFGTALPLPGMEQESLLASKIRMVMEMQCPGFGWTEQLYRRETSSGSGLFRITHVTLWESGDAADAFRFGKEAGEWRNKNLDMVIPGSFDGVFYRILYNPHFQKLTHATNLLRQQQQQQNSSGSSNNNKDEDDSKSSNNKNNREKEEISSKKTNTDSNKEQDKAITYPAFGPSSFSSSTNCLTVQQEHAYAVFIDVSPKRKHSTKKGKGNTKINKRELLQDSSKAISLFMSLLFASEVCAVHEKGCLRYMILFKSRGQQKDQQQRLFPNKGITKDNEYHQQQKRDNNYTVYAVFINEEAFHFHSKQGYSVLSDRFKAMCAPLFPKTTAYTRNTI